MRFTLTLALLAVVSAENFFEEEQDLDYEDEVEEYEEEDDMMELAKDKPCPKFMKWAAGVCMKMKVPKDKMKPCTIKVMKCAKVCAKKIGFTKKDMKNKAMLKKMKMCGAKCMKMKK